MPVVAKKENKAFKIESCPACSVCATSKEEIYISCANVNCDHKMHVACAVRPERTRLHFCSWNCVRQYAER